MEIPVTYIFTHDSIGVGEDGPTHQPVEQLISLRAIPGLITLRPGDANEVAEAWRIIMTMQHEAVCLILSRQNMPTLDRTKFAPASGVAKGAYTLIDSHEGTPEVILIGTGTEVGLCVDAYERLVKDGVKARVVSMPSWELFAHQSEEYQHSVLPPSVQARVSVEQASTFGWSAYAERNIGMKTFGASAPLKELQKKFGFTSRRCSCRREGRDRQTQLGRPGGCLPLLSQNINSGRQLSEFFLRALPAQSAESWCPLFISSGYSVVAMTRTVSKCESLRVAGAEPVVADGLDREAVRNAVLDARPEVVVQEMTAIGKLDDLKHYDDQFALTNPPSNGGDRSLAQSGTGSRSAAFRRPELRRMAECEDRRPRQNGGRSAGFTSPQSDAPVTGRNP